ncbi:hypothetical protein PENSPDRAFT_207926 [Peniophora sp. CONT]|nr:hypothetical protein PENSPDRAFT_207926 [Peniophora sp. CONT]
MKKFFGGREKASKLQKSRAESEHSVYDSTPGAAAAVPPIYAARARTISNVDSDDDRHGWEHVPSDAALVQPQPPTSRSSSLASVVQQQQQQQLPPREQTHSQRTASPLPPPKPNAAAAVNILKSLDPQFVQHRDQDRDSLAHEAQHQHAPGQKAGFWGWAQDRRADQHAQHDDIMRMIGPCISTPVVAKAQRL